MKLSIIIELKYSDEDCIGPLQNSYVEHVIEGSLARFLNNEGLKVTHLEAAPGSLKDSFGIEEYESQKAALTQALEQSVKEKA